jgi:RNA polymerase sigma-70 factor (ECF subfamily)
MMLAIGSIPREEREVFAGHLRELMPAAYRLAYGMLQSPPDAEDAVQDALLNAWRAQARLRPDSDLRAWFLTIVANQCRQQRRSRWWSVLKRADVTPAEASAPAETPDRDLCRALMRLPHDQRLAIVLRYYLDQTFEDVGRALGISPKAAQSRVHRALARLRPHVQEVFDDAR